MYFGTYTNGRHSAVSCRRELGAPGEIEAMRGD